MSKLAPFNFYLLRMPVFSYSNILVQLGNKKDLDDLKTIIDQPIFKEAIFLASAELYEAFQKRLKDELGEKKDKLSTSIYKYLLRMATRSTPYGLFAGCALGNITPKPTNIELEGMTNDKIYRLDTGCLEALVETIPFLDEQLLQETIFFQIPVFTMLEKLTDIMSIK